MNIEDLHSPYGVAQSNVHTGVSAVIAPHLGLHGVAEREFVQLVRSNRQCHGPRGPSLATLLAQRGGLYDGSHF